MSIALRRTIVAHGRLRTRELRLAAARGREHGLQVMTFEQLAVRLAGGLHSSVSEDDLCEAIRKVLPDTPLGTLDRIKNLPGMITAAANTLRKAWRSDINLAERAGHHPRLRSVAQLEEAVLQALPPSGLRPADLVSQGRQRIEHAPALFGSIDIVGITELSPVWRPLLQALAGRVRVRWIAGSRPVPDWLSDKAVELVRKPAQKPQCPTVSASTPYHEAIEALRWARQLIATRGVAPGDIGIASASHAQYDDFFLALREEADFDLHVVHGVPVTACRAGQPAAALADVLLRGLSQTRIRRLNTLLRASPGVFQALPENWTHVLPADAPLTSLDAWTRVINTLPREGTEAQLNTARELRRIMALLAKGLEAAEEAGERLLRGQTRTIWRNALRRGAIAALDRNLTSQRLDDGLEPCVSICWMRASELAAAPRRFVRLLGLNSSRWPRAIVEDRLLSDHVVPTTELDPLPAAAADQRDFQTILNTTKHEVVLSYARRDEEGRLLGRSPLLVRTGANLRALRRNRVPEHAFSETDRLLARPEELRRTAQAKRATACWRNWRKKEITPHDGLIRAAHPGLSAVLARVQSASSLRLLLRNPLGFVWKYGLQMRAAEIIEDPLILDPRAMGELVHQFLEKALRRMQSEGIASNATDQQRDDCLSATISEVAQQWKEERPVPPAIIWRQTLDGLLELGRAAFSVPDEWWSAARSYAEVPFGGKEPGSDAELPWDPATQVEIPDTGFFISGYIDRLDLSPDGHHATVCDYKTGKPPRKSDLIISGGNELQRCLYSFAAKTILGDDVQISATLHYLRDGSLLPLADPAATLEELAGYLAAARRNMEKGNALIGEDTGNQYDDLLFALPANAEATYCARKRPAAYRRLADATRVWTAE